MKKLVLAAAIFAAITAGNTATAQDMQSRPKQSARNAAMYDSLGLSADQRVKMDALYESRRADMMALRNDATLTDDQRKAKMKEMHAAQKAKLDAILTPAQAAKFESMTNEMRKKRQEQDHPTN